MSLTWTDDLNTGIPEIDSQNRRVLDFINTLNRAGQPADRAVVGDVLEQLLDYVVNNFLFEEHMMEVAGYEFRSNHERIHELFAKRLADFRGRYAAGEDVSADLHTMLKNWVDVHVRQEDKKYAATVQQTISKEGGRGWVQGIMKKLFG